MNNIVLDKILNRFFEFEQVKSVAIWSSGVNNTSDNMSDIDILETSDIMVNNLKILLENLQ